MQQPLLKVQNISKTRANKTVLQDISFDIYEGEMLALLGANGAGKSSLIAILASLCRPSAGTILWRGISHLEQLIDYRMFVGYGPQNQTLEPSQTIRQALQFQGRYYGLQRKESADRAEQLIEQFSLKGYADAFPYLLSGGYKQRFVIAKAFMHQPRFLLLDEISVGLDTLTKNSLWETLTQLQRKGVTILFTTHYLLEAEQIANRICILNEGSIQAVNTPTGLKEQLKQSNLESAFLKLLTGNPSCDK